jgi:hypothetical protein
MYITASFGIWKYACFLSISWQDLRTIKLPGVWNVSYMSATHYNTDCFNVMFCTVKFRGPSEGNKCRDVYGCSTHSVLSDIFKEANYIKIKQVRINRHLLDQRG